MMVWWNKLLLLKIINLKWYFVEITDKKGFENLKNKIKKAKLEALLKKGLNPVLIDVTLKNATASISNLTKHKEFFTKSGIIKKTNEYHYIESKKKNIFAAILQKELKPDSSIVSLFLVNRSCLGTGTLEEDGGTFDVVAGFSPTGTGLAYMTLEDGDKIQAENIIHEIMHALGLEHTFSKKSAHTFDDTKTKNYMDYDNVKRLTWKWQWEKLRNYSHLKLLLSDKKSIKN